MKIHRAVVVASVYLCLLGCTGSDKPAAVESRQETVTKRDFFFYSCVHAYMKANGIRRFDSSPAYAVEYSDLSAEELTRLHDAAMTFAGGIAAPNYKDEEHGLQAVLMLCEKEAVKFSD